MPPTAGLHALTPGQALDDLLVEVVGDEMPLLATATPATGEGHGSGRGGTGHGGQGGGSAHAASGGNNPGFSVQVRDPTGYATLVYRSTNACRPTDVKRGRVLTVSGKATSHGGRLQLQVGSSWGRVARAKGEQLPPGPPPGELADASGWRRLYGVVLLRRAPAPGGGPVPAGDRPLQLYVPDHLITAGAGAAAAASAGPASAAPAAGGAASSCAAGSRPPFPAAPAAYLDTEREAAIRAAQAATGIPPGAFRLTPLPALSRLHLLRAEQSPRSPPEPCVTSAYVGLCDSPTEMCDGGAWLPLPAGLAHWPAEWAALAAQLRESLATAATLGLLPKGEAEASGLFAPPAGAPAVPAGPSAAPAPAPAPAPVLGPAPPAGAVAAPAPGAAGGPAPRPLLPVTILSGFLGAGKTSLLQHVLRCPRPGPSGAPLRIAVLVNDMAALNVDAALIKSGGGLRPEAGEQLLELHNGCICCTLREDLLHEVAALARAGSVDYLLIESSGISEPLQVAQTFTFELDGPGQQLRAGEGPAPAGPAPAAAAAIPVALRDLARLDTCVTVIDAASFWGQLGSVESLRERDGPEAVPEEDERNVADLLVDQVEFADVIILNKMDLVSSEQAARVAAAVARLNPAARVLRATRGVVDPAEVVLTDRFSYARAAAAPGWLQALRGEGQLVPETVEYGIASFVWRARRPFHPARLHALLEGHFVLQQADWSEALAAEEEGHGGHGHDHHHHHHHHGHSHEGHGHSHHGHRHGHGPSHEAHGHEGHGHKKAGGRGAQRDGGGSMQAAAHSAAQAAAAAADSAGAAARSLMSGRAGAPAGVGAIVAAAAAAAAAAASAASAAAAAAAALGAAADDRPHPAAAAASARRGGGSARPAPPPPPPPPPAPKPTAESVFAKQQTLASSFGQLLRSKGFCWLATRHDLCGDWGSAGGVLQLRCGGPWFDALPRESWPTDAAQRADILQDFADGGAAEGAALAAAAASGARGGARGGPAGPAGPRPAYGDRRQELVFIGIRVNQPALAAALEACLLSDDEMAGGPAAWGRLEDPFLVWPPLEALLQGEEEEEGEGEEGEDDDGMDRFEDDGVDGADEGEGEEDEEEEEEEEEEPVGVIDVIAGGSDLQQLLDYADAPLAVVHWRADWAPSACDPAGETLQALAGARPPGELLCLEVDVGASEENMSLGLQLLFQRPESRRPGARPTLQAGPAGPRKLPAVSLHLPPAMYPWRVLTGAEAAGPRLAEAIEAALVEAGAGRAAADGDARGGAGAGGSAGAGPSAGRASSLAAAPAAASVAEAVRELARGAADLKTLLQSLGADGIAVVAWVDGGGDGDGAPAPAAAGSAPGNGVDLAALARSSAALAGAGVLRFAQIAVGASRENAALAAKLEPGQRPVIHIYQGLKRAVRLAGPAALAGAKLEAALAALCPPAPPAPPPGASAAGAASAGGFAAGSSRAAEAFDPPAGKLAKAGATRRFPRGMATYLPKTPCLRCGSPWWLGEDWDARCARCGWECEAAGNGYDEDSQPLPRLKAKWERFTALFREGRTAKWP